MDKRQGSEPRIEGHVYDGIEELDHGIPNWFRVLFYGTIAFGMAYLFYYTAGEGPTLVEEYERVRRNDEIAAFERTKIGARVASEDELLAIAREASRKEAGAAIFRSKCVSCHGARAQGGIGPNLTDEYWIHGGRISEILATVTKGVLDKGMPPWGSMLSDEDVQSVVAYVWSVRGSNPPEAKAPQGERVPGPR